MQRQATPYVEVLPDGRRVTVRENEIHIEGDKPEDIIRIPNSIPDSRIAQLLVLPNGDIFALIKSRDEDSLVKLDITGRRFGIKKAFKHHSQLAIPAGVDHRDKGPHLCNMQGSILQTDF